MLAAISVVPARRLLHRPGHLAGGRGLLLHGARRWWSAGRRSARRCSRSRSIAATAAVVSPWIASTRRAMSSVAFAVSCASSLTSLATTAKPLPASPARAASIVAFSASRLVCSAMLVITFTTLPISAEDSPSLATVAVVVSAAVTARAATSLASAAFDGDLAECERAHLLSAPAATVCTLRLTSSAADEHDTGLSAGLLRRGRDLRRRASSSEDAALTASRRSQYSAISRIEAPICSAPAATRLHAAATSCGGGGRPRRTGRRSPRPRPRSAPDDAGQLLGDEAATASAEPATSPSTDAQVRPTAVSRRLGPSGPARPCGATSVGRCPW